MITPQNLNVLRSAASPTSALIGYVVRESAANTVAVSTDATTEVPFGVVRDVDADLAKVSVTASGEARARVGEGGLALGVGFLAAADDGRVVAATAGEFYVGRPLDLTKAHAAGDMIRIFVQPGQLSIAEST